jgi:DNA-nicking Smr family endonuclease
MTRDKSIAALEKTMQSSLQTSDRVICVIHGRGLHSPDGRPVLKHRIYQWLKDGPMSAYVLAVTPAPNTAGGSCLVLLRRDKHK